MDKNQSHTLFEKLDLTADERLAHIVRSVARGFQRSLERRLADHQIPFGHWVFLRILWAEDGLSQKELANRSGLTGATVHTAIQKMENLKLVERKVPKGKRNRPVICLTRHGRDLEKTLVPLAIETNMIATKGMSDEEIKTLRSTLLKMAAHLAEDQNGCA